MPVLPASSIHLSLFLSLSRTLSYTYTHTHYTQTHARTQPHAHSQIDKAEFKKALGEIGETPTDEEVDAAFDEVDRSVFIGVFIG